MVTELPEKTGYWIITAKWLLYHQQKPYQSRDPTVKNLEYHLGENGPVYLLFVLVILHIQPQLDLPDGIFSHGSGL